MNALVGAASRSTTLRALRGNPFSIPSSLLPRSFSTSSHTSISSSASHYLAGATAAIATAAAAYYLFSSSSAAPIYTRQPAPALDPSKYAPLKLKKVVPYNHNTKTYIFECAHADDLPVSSFVLAKVDGLEKDSTVRPYTPINISLADGEVHLLIKSYPHGKLTPYIDKLPVGSTLDIQGPLVNFPYTPNSHNSMVFLAAGTGLTPCLQIIRKVLSNPEDKTKLKLVFANISEADILLRKELDELVEKYGKDKFDVVYLIENGEPHGKNMRKGRVSEGLIKEVGPKPGSGGMVLVCGPPGFYNVVSGGKAPDYSQGELSGMLKALGYKKEEVFKL